MRRDEEGRAGVVGALGRVDRQDGPRADLERGPVGVAGGRPERSSAIASVR